MMEVTKCVLTGKQEQFCLEYLVDLNATQAAIRAGYSAKTANAIGWGNLSKPNVQQRIAQLKQERSERVKVNADYVLKRLVEIDQMDVLDILEDDGSLRSFKAWPQSWRQFISGMDVMEVKGRGNDGALACIKKVKWPDKVKNLELIGRHVDVRAFREHVALTGKDGGPVQLTETDRAAKVSALLALAEVRQGKKGQQKAK